QGYIAKSQRRKVYAKRWDYIKRYGLGVVIGLAFYIAVLVDGVQRGNISLAGVVLGTVIVGGVPIVFIVIIEDRRRRIKSDLYQGDLESVSGYVEVIPGRAARNREYGWPPRLKVGSKEFETPALPNNVFVDGEIYRVFYVPQSMSIVAVE